MPFKKFKKSLYLLAMVLGPTYLLESITAYSHIDPTTENISAASTVDGKINFLNKDFLRQMKREGRPVNVVIHGWTNYDPEMLKKLSGYSHYQKRDLYHLMLIGKVHHQDYPAANIVYLTSEDISETYIRYMIELGAGKRLNDEVYEELRKRLKVVKFSGGDPYGPLAEKILLPENEGTLKELKGIMGQVVEESGGPFLGLSIFATHPAEKALADELQIPLLGADPQHEPYGTKSGSREIFTQAQVDFPAGIPLVRSVPSLSSELAKVLLQKKNAQNQKGRTINKMIIKLDKGISGKGNEVLKVGDLVEKAGDDVNLLAQLIEERIKEGPGKLDESYQQQIASPDMGAIAEEFIEGEFPSFPSVQVMLDRDGRHQVISTHEQILGGDSGQVYLGCEYPAVLDYNNLIVEATDKIAKALSSQHVAGPFGVDYIVVQVQEGDKSVWKAYPLEINLRKLGTTHPYGTARLVTNDQVRYYIASDNKRITQKEYEGLPGDELIQRLQRHPRLHFNPEKQEGVVVHLTDALKDFNKVGVTCLAQNRERARNLCEEFQQFLDQEAKDYYQKRKRR